MVPARANRMRSSGHRSVLIVVVGVVARAGMDMVILLGTVQCEGDAGHVTRTTPIIPRSS